MSWRLQLLDGPEALAELHAAAVDGSWQRLAAADPRPTWFQEPAFVLAWYAAYADVARPLVAIGRDDGGLIGLLSLAHLAGGEITHAGANHAWYAGWIAQAALDAEFITAAVDAVLQRQRPRYWLWKHLPRGYRATWTDDLRAGAALTSERLAPVWDLTEPDAIERHLKPRLRNYMNRYRRAGGLRLDRLRGDAAVRALHIVAPWYELRHGAVHADLPFRDDPRKMPFHEQLAGNDEAVHTAVLRFGERPLAVHIGPWDGERLIAGLYGFDPTESKQSPGNILMLELAAAVRQLGGHEMDLTPGGESWKDLFASRHDPVVRLELSASSARARARRVGRGAMGAVRELLHRFGVTPQDVRRLAAPLLGGPAELPFQPLRIFELDVAAAATPSEVRPVSNGVEAAWLQHLLAIDGVRERAAASASLSLAMRLLHRGWLPLVHEQLPPPSTVVWLPPADCTVIVPDEPQSEPLAAIRDGAPQPPGTRLPDDARLLLVGHDCGDASILANLIAAAAPDGGRVWIAATELTTTTEAWLQERAQPAGPARVAA